MGTFFLMVFMRQWRVLRTKLFDYLLEYMLIWPLCFGLGSGYLSQLMYFGPGHEKKATILFMGSVLLQMVIVSFGQGADFLTERQKNGVISYYQSVGSLRTLFAARVFFSTLVTFFSVLPFLPVVKLFIGHYCYTGEISWVNYSGVLFLSSLMITTYNYCMTSFLAGIGSVGNLWVRCNEPLMWFGGFWAPFLIMQKSWPISGYISQLSPFLYITEALRRALVPSDAFFTHTYSMTMLCLFTVLFYLLGLYLLRRRLDAVKGGT